MRDVIRAVPIPIQWDPSLPIFGKEEFLKSVGDEYGWLGGIDQSGKRRCILPYTIVRKAGLRLVRFRDKTILCGELDFSEEKAFLNSVVEHFRKRHADVIIPASNNALFRTYPDGASTAPYGSYVIDLQQPEDVLWRNVARIMRQNIGCAKRNGVSIREGMDFLEPAHRLVSETFRRSGIPFMPLDAFRRFADGLGENGKLLRAEYQGVVHSYCLFAYSAPCAYAIYAGNLRPQHQGANKLLYWEAIRLFRSVGVRTLDFFGARISPEQGSKQEAMNLLKRHLGAALSEGYMWKYSLRPWRASIYSVAIRFLRGGDVVDQEGPRLKDYRIRIGN